MSMRCVLVARRDSGIRITDFERDIKGLRIGTVRDNAAEQFLLAHGADPANLQCVHDVRLNLKKLVEGRIDALAVLEGVLGKTLKDMDLDPDDFEVAYTLMSADLYYAASRSMAPSVPARLQKALEQLKAEGAVEDVVGRYCR